MMRRSCVVLRALALLQVFLWATHYAKAERRGGAVRREADAKGGGAFTSNGKEPSQLSGPDFSCSLFHGVQFAADVEPIETVQVAGKEYGHCCNICDKNSVCKSWTWRQSGDETHCLLFKEKHSPGKADAPSSDAEGASRHVSGWLVENTSWQERILNGKSQSDPTLCEFHPNGTRKLNEDGTPKLRVRKDWNEMTQEEKDLYMEAFSIFSDSGLHNLFLDVHVYSSNMVQGHSTSLFFHWHRIFLVAVENTLRLLDPRFQCLTIPYWNWASESSRAQQKGLQTLLEAHTILRETGGSGDGKFYAGQTFYGAKYEGRCCTGCNRFGWGRHSAMTLNGTTIQKRNCLVRGEYHNTPAKLPTLGRLMSLLLDYPEYGRGDGFRGHYEPSMHGTTHVTSGGTMPTMCSPIDVIFFSHHSAVDKHWTLWSDYYGHYKRPATDPIHFQPSSTQACDSLECELSYKLPSPNSSAEFYAPDFVKILHITWPYYQNEKGELTPYRWPHEIMHPSQMGKYAYHYTVGPVEQELFADKVDNHIEESFNASANLLDISGLKMAEETPRGEDGFRWHQFVVLSEEEQNDANEEFRHHERAVLDAKRAVKEKVCSRLNSKTWQDKLKATASSSSLAKLWLNKGCVGRMVQGVIWEQVMNEECYAQFTEVQEGELKRKKCKNEGYSALGDEAFRVRGYSNYGCCDILRSVDKGEIKLIAHDAHLSHATFKKARDTLEEDEDAKYLDAILESLIHKL